MSKFKKFALSLIVLGLVTSFVTMGTFASFTAQTTNPSNSFSSGTLVLSNTKTGGTACLSTGGATTDTNRNGSCDTLINTTTSKPGDTAYQTLTLQNAGSLDASNFKLFSTACAAADNAESFHGTGNPCSVIQLTIQQYSDSAFTTPSACLYGGSTGNSCNFTDTTKTLSSFQSSYSSSASSLVIGSGLTAGSNVYIKIGMQLPTTANNTYQGRKATLDFNWLLEQ